MSDIDLEKLLEPHHGDLKAIAAAASRRDRRAVIDGVATLVLTLATGNPLVGLLAPLGRKGVAKVFGNSVNDVLERELEAMQKEGERQRFLDQIDDVIAALIGQALVQIVKSQHSVKDEVLESLGCVRADFEQFRRDFERRLAAEGEETLRIHEQLVSEGGLGIRVRETTTKRVALTRQVVTGPGSVGVDLGE